MWWKIAQAKPMPQLPGAAGQEAATPAKWSNVVFNNGQWKFFDNDGKLVGGPTNNFEQFAAQADTNNATVAQKLQGIRSDIASFRNQAAGKPAATQNQLEQSMFSKYGDSEYLPAAQAGQAAPTQTQETDQDKRARYTQSYNTAYQQWIQDGQKIPFQQFKANFDKQFQTASSGQRLPGYEAAQTAPQGQYTAREDGHGGVSLYAPNAQQPYSTIPASQRSAPSNQAYIQKMTGKPDAPPAQPPTPNQPPAPPTTPTAAPTVPNTGNPAAKMTPPLAPVAPATK
jgi:hypothetical protein